MLRERWWSRVVPVTALAVGLVAVLALLVPGVRGQLALSATHQPQQYVGLAFARTPAGTVTTCATGGGRLQVAFDVISHLDRPRELTYTVAVPGQERTGSVTVDPGETARVTRSVELPRARHFEVSVELPDAGRQLLAHCPGDLS